MTVDDRQAAHVDELAALHFLDTKFVEPEKAAKLEVRCAEQNRCDKLAQAAARSLRVAF